MTTIHYLATRAIGSSRARTEVRRLLSLFQIAPVNRGVLEAALENGFSDFEDAVAHEPARHVNAKVIVTRNVRDFRRSRIPVRTPEGFLALLEAQGDDEG